MFFSDFNVNEMYLAVVNSFAEYDNAITPTLRFSMHGFMLLSCASCNYISHSRQDHLTCFADVLENTETARKCNSTEHQKCLFFVKKEHHRAGL